MTAVRIMKCRSLGPRETREMTASTNKLELPEEQGREDGRGDGRDNIGEEESKDETGKKKTFMSSD